MNIPSAPDPYYLQVLLDRNLNLSVHLSGVALAVLAVVIVAVLILLAFSRKWFLFARQFDIDEAELGLGNKKIRLRPNTTDIQIAYKIWVELSTRKIGIPLDLDHDVISDVYDSWYEFFSVTREHIKDVPATRFSRRETERIIKLSIDVLNVGVRPHLTQWQARFRRWYERQIVLEENSEITPQEIQRKFPQYDELVQDLRAVNLRLIQYRHKLHELISGR